MGMYKVIIVDDEEAVRNGLANHFDWAKHNMEVAGVFEDGLPAFFYVKENPVDLIVTDVRMSRMDGTKLARNVMELFPNIKVIFISGYADVDYLKDALKMDAVDYILKSIDTQELDAVVTKVEALLDARQDQEQMMLDIAKKLEQSMPLLRQQRLSDLLRETDKEKEELLQEFEFLGIPLNNHARCAVLVLKMQPKSRFLVMGSMSEKERLATDIALEEMFAKAVSKYGSSVAFRGGSGEHVAILDIENDEYEENLIGFAKSLQKQIENDLKLETMIGISEPFSGLQSVRAAYQNACESISRGYLISRDVPIAVQKYAADSYGHTLREQAEREVCDSISSGDVDKIRSVLEKFVEGVRGMQDETEQQNFMLFLLFLPNRLLTNVRIGEMGSYASQRKLAAVFLQCSSLEEQEVMLNTVYEDLAQHLQKLSTPQTNAVIKRVKDIILERYMEQLSIVGLAGEVYLTPAYLCVLFKQATGQTINEYITMVRLNRAKELLEYSNIHLYDVCYKVGYLSPSYFSRLFKKYTGQTPGDYRKNTTLGICPRKKEGDVNGQRK